MRAHVQHDFGRFAAKVDEQERSFQKRMARVGREISEYGLTLYERTTTGWSWDPQFRAQVRMLGYVLTVDIGTDDWKYRMIDETGARAHPITPRGPWPLRFRWGGPGSYRAKTIPGYLGVQMAGGRVSGGKMVYRMRVMHPGFKPRLFSKAISEILDKEIVKEMDKDLSMWATQWG